MTETNIFRKNKINLEDYDYQKDIQNRVLMSHFSPEDLEVLEEIVYSSQRIPISRLVSQLDKNLDELQLILDKLSKTDLFKIEEDTVVVDKEMRKYFETQIQKFEDDFTPGMEFLQALLKKVPIHVLPNWYPIPRTSNNIFESLVEKYLFTPHHFQRYIEDLQSKDEIISGIIQDVFTANNYKMYAEELKLKYNLSNIDFAKYMLILEYSFALCLTYTNIDGYWKETVTPFYEWNKYMKFLSDTSTPSIQDTKSIKRNFASDFVFV